MASASHPSDEDPWSISVKTVGIGFTADEEAATADASTCNANGERTIVVEVSPDDGVASLHAKIEGATGLKASQQRLIYRGRLIGGGKYDQSDADEQQLEPKIKDIAGLCDGQTIHLVKKRETEEGAESDRNSSEEGTSSSSRSNFENDILGSSSGGGSGGSLLAALLGLGNLPDDNEESETRTPRWGWRSSRRSLGRSRRPHYRLTAEDLEVPDPGSMEPVRQGLMTLHTLLPHARQSNSNGPSTPLEANREWYRGQWVDCRDTVNQWLEATVVEIMDPEDILPLSDRIESSSSSGLPRHRRQPSVSSDPAVSAADLEGRRRLLLEPCESDDPDEEEGSLAGFRRRDNNGVQLLLIHYNGWPHRWDEWIRSDSERIRPFRTRTRHPSVSTTASPTPQSIFNEAPRTNMRYGDESEDREALLPELFRAVTIVNSLLSDVVQGTASSVTIPPVESHDDLPWLREVDPIIPSANSSSREGDKKTGESSDSNEHHGADERAESATGPTYTRSQLQSLAPLLDRLGRTLTDAAPHIASLAESLPDNVGESSVDSDNEEIPDDLPNLEGDMPPLGGLLSVWNRERRRQNLTNEESNSELPSNAVDPDHVDYASGVVNTTRGEVRTGPRSRPQNDDVASLLGAYLAAASLGGGSGSDNNDDEDGGAPAGLGRLLRERGSGGTGGSGGIDIHIHAVVTAPGGGGGGGLGLTTLGGPIPAVTGGGGRGGTRTLFTPSTRDRSTRVPSSILRSSRHSPTPYHSTNSSGSDDIEDAGLFSELYSETPEPVNPNGSPEPGERRAALPDSIERNHNTSDFMSRLNDLHADQSFEDPVSISTTRRNRRSNNSSPRRQSSERRSGWGRLFSRRRRRSDHRDSL